MTTPKDEAAAKEDPNAPVDVTIAKSCVVDREVRKVGHQMQVTRTIAKQLVSANQAVYGKQKIEAPKKETA